MDAQHPLGVVTPTLDGDVLTCLVRADASFTAGQLRRLLPHASTDGIRKVLNRLAAQGIVTTSRGGGRAVMYALNRDHLAAPAVIALAEQRTELIARLEKVLGSWQSPPTYAALFGSWARGRTRTGSDVDLFLVRPDDTEDKAWDEQVAEFEQAVTRWTGNDGRAFVVNRSELKQLADDPVISSIRTEGLTLHGSKNAFLKATRSDSAVAR